MRIIINLVILVILFSSCEKVVQLDLSNNEDKLVVEGSITNQPGPYFIILTRSVNFNDPSTYPAVSNALVVITDNTGQRDTLTYISNATYKTNNLQGVEGRTYSLHIVSDGKDYTAQSTMPAQVNLDSLRVNVFLFNGENQINIIPVYKDPQATGNNYFFKQTVNGKLDKTYYAFNDNLNNGQSSQRPLRSNDIDLELKSGDVVQIEMQCVDLNVYTYYFALSQESAGGLGGGSTPANPPNNITGNALGIFSAHTSQTKTIIIP